MELSSLLRPSLAQTNKKLCEPSEYRQLKLGSEHGYRQYPYPVPSLTLPAEALAHAEAEETDRTTLVRAVCLFARSQLCFTSDD